MVSLRQSTLWFIAATLISCCAVSGALDLQPNLPPFGRDTVLVWKTENQDDTPHQFVVRLAQFEPGRYLEWEDSTTQGTIFMSEKAVKNARTFMNARLFEGGVDTRGKDATTLWLSQRLFHDLKEKGRVKLSLDSVDGWMTVDGTDQVSVEVNRSAQMIPVLKVKDDRGSERWFLDSEENPLLVKHLVRAFSQTLISVTTDKPNTLRWIKGKKLNAPQ